MNRSRLAIPTLAAAALVAGCQPITVEHKVDPIYITVDINLKVDRELDEFFDFEEEIEADTVEIDVEPGEGDVEIETGEMDSGGDEAGGDDGGLPDGGVQ